MIIIEIVSSVLRDSAAQRYLTSSYGEEHPDVARAKNSVACVLQRQGHDEEALSIFQQVVSFLHEIESPREREREREHARVIAYTRQCVLKKVRALHV